ncbi:MAG TPA: lysophospholipase [Acidimicrobiia bacterium]
MSPTKSTTRNQPNEIYGTELIREWGAAGARRGRVVLVHGLAEHTGRYERVGSIFAESGFDVVAPDLFGFGRSGGERADVGDWGDYLDQVGRLIAASGRPVILLGHSMGGLVATSYALSDRPQPDLLVLSAPAIGGGAGWQKALAPVLARIAPKMLIPNNLKGEQLSRDPLVGEAYFSDPLMVFKTTTRLGNQLFTAQAAAAPHLGELPVPTLVMHGGSDSIVPPASTVVLGEADGVERRLYPKLRHEIFNEPEGPQLVAEVVDWIEENLGSSG